MTTLARTSLVLSALLWLGAGCGGNEAPASQSGPDTGMPPPAAATSSAATTPGASTGSTTTPPKTTAGSPSRSQWLAPGP